MVIIGLSNYNLNGINKIGGIYMIKLKLKDGSIMEVEKVDKIQYVDEQVFTKDNTTKEVINKRAY